MANIIITGSSGFIGRHWLAASQYTDQAKEISLQTTTVNEIDFSSIDTIIHLAGIAHRMDQPSGEIYYRINCDLTIELARMAKSKGVRHFIFISTVKVYGDHLEYMEESTQTLPDDDYGKSKLEAEQGILKLEEKSFKVSIIRPPLVYGPGVKGNLLQLLQLVDKNWPLPFKGITNKRSMVYVYNLIALIDTITEQQLSGVFIAGDRNVISTSYLVELISKGLDRPIRWFKLPTLFRYLLALIKPSVAKRLFGSYIIDNRRTNEQLGFTPPYTTETGIFKMAEWYKKRNISL